MPIPSKAIRNAVMALQERERFNPKPMTKSGLLTARLIANGKLPKSRYGKVYSFLARTIAQQNKNPTKRRLVAINGWGGKEMYNYLKNKRG
jgi:hypothetical protein|tara:strand:- start:665 stop:937 length:273 start_codon:yes stop_codon:yes gene_type:complete